MEITNEDAKEYRKTAAELWAGYDVKIPDDAKVEIVEEQGAWVEARVFVARPAMGFDVKNPGWGSPLPLGVRPNDEKRS